MMALLSGRRCVPFVFRVDPPDVVSGAADYVFYTGELAQAAEVMRACAERFDVELALAPIDIGGGQTLRPTVYRVR